MLITLSIENFAIIDAVQIDFRDGMSVLSGETGAGKSIIIDALGILCGGRGSTSFIREGFDKLIVEGMFSLEKPRKVQRELDKLGMEIDLSQDPLIIRREIQKSGTNIVRLNGQLSNVSTLKKIGQYLSDIHGQNEHQSLLNPREHLKLLDAFGEPDHQALLTAYREQYNTYRDLRTEWLNSHQDETDERQRLSFIEFQATEIEELQLIKGEDEELEATSRRLQNQQDFIRQVEELNQLFTDSDFAILGQLEKTQELLSAIEKMDNRFAELPERISQVTYEIEDIAGQIALSDMGEIDNQSIDEIEARLMELSQAKRKYNMTIPEILTYYEEISEEIFQITHKEQYIEKLAAKVESAYDATYELAAQLHKSRQFLAINLTDAILKELDDLYMGNSRFDVRFTESQQDEALMTSLSAITNQKSYLQLNAYGYDMAEFFVATNAGESLKPLIRVASGGELSRFMLALKTVFSRDSLPKTMVFDEIDTGVSGRVAQAIAQKMALISNIHQVLCITHLPQVAAIAETQLFISKAVQQGRTVSRVDTLDRIERQETIAKMISGEETTSASLELAEELLSQYHTKGSDA